MYLGTRQLESYVPLSYTFRLNHQSLEILSAIYDQSTWADLVLRKETTREHLPLMQYVYL